MTNKRKQKKLKYIVQLIRKTKQLKSLEYAELEQEQRTNNTLKKTEI
jgi:hypothetical protein